MDGQSLKKYTSILTCNMQVDYSQTEKGVYDFMKNVHMYILEYKFYPCKRLLISLYFNI